MSPGPGRRVVVHGQRKHDDVQSLFLRNLPDRVVRDGRNSFIARAVIIVSLVRIRSYGLRFIYEFDALRLPWKEELTELVGAAVGFLFEHHCGPFGNAGTGGGDRGKCRQRLVPHPY